MSDKLIVVAEMNDDIDSSMLVPSKSQRKREAEAQTDLGKKLLAMKPNARHMLPLAGELKAALDEAEHIFHHTAKKRHMKLVGKLLRAMDTQELEDVIARIEKDECAKTQHFHQVEQWRDRLIAEGDPAIHALISTYPLASRQQIREWVRQAKREATQSKPPKASRVLFKYLRDLMTQQTAS